MTLTTEILKLQLHVECPICFEVLSDAHTIPDCQHRFCGDCIKQALQSGTGCPTCRKYIESTSVLRVDASFHVMVQTLGRLISDCEISSEISEIEQIQFALKGFMGYTGYLTCQLCNNILKEAFLSTQCNHRFCFDCVSSVNEMCPCCRNSNVTNMVEDRQYGDLVKAINNMISFLNHESQGNGQANKDTTVVMGNTEKTRNHKLKLGTRFIHPGPPEKYGRIVGYDAKAKYYQVYYPKTLECESLSETFMSKMTLVTHKRPRMKRKLSVEEMQKLATAPSCEFCNIPFEAATDSGKCPIQSQNCSHLLCFDCIQAMRVRETQNNPKKIRSTVDCPFCDGRRSFNAAHPTVCQAMCQMVTLFQSRNIKYLADSDKASSKVECSTNKRPLLGKPSSKNNMSCLACKQAKPAEKFSSKQLKRKSTGKGNLFCRRCEEKDAIKRKFGSYDGKCATSLIMKNGSKKSKFLSTILPVSAADGSGVVKQTDLPSHLHITGYTREAYAHLSNTNDEHLWQKQYFWSSNYEKMEGLLSFLQTEQKSAYGTFILEKKNVDGFFIIPYDQPKDMLKGFLKCKYVLGVGFMDDLNTLTMQNLKALILMKLKLVLFVSFCIQSQKPTNL